VVEYFPELKDFIKWHLVGSDSPMHYVANTIYHAEQGNLKAARSCAMWPEATDEDLTAPGLKERLEARLPALLAAFKQDIKILGLQFEPEKQNASNTK
jgi:hypothetical protein